ncbi:MAG: bifunctional DNA-binding transcriptional regulator/O6-methylguanine-DNA methyltransferase Ada [Anaerolineales bacterium]
MQSSKNKIMEFTDFTSETSRWQAVLQRNPQSDGAFIYGVLTTGIYCRPVCTSRLPNRENVRFFDSWQDAEAAGLRPCKRCAPQAVQMPNEAAAAVEKACEMIEEAENEPTLDQLAEAVGLSPAYFQRLFKKTVGITPKQYVREKRLGRIRTHLQEDSSVTEAIYHAGYGSGSRFYEKATESLGMKPNEYRQGGPGFSIRYAIVKCYLGWVLVAATDHGICRIDLDDSPDILKNRLESTFQNARYLQDDADIRDIAAQTIAFLDTPAAGLDLSLDVQGTAFQHRVWAALQRIPCGQTASYGEIARQIGDPKAARAVAGACAANPVAVAIPCHRVVKSDGKLGGYRWGIERKLALLEREKREKSENP